MNPSASPATNPAVSAAAEWMLRHDRGLTAVEQDEFSNWLTADPRHRAAWAETRWGWDEFDRLAGLQSSVHAVPDPDLLLPGHLAPVRPRPLAPLVRFALPLLAAAVVVLTFILWTKPPAGAADPVRPVAPATIALIEQRDLADGSTLTLNRGAVVSEHFTTNERRVRLERGEAHFTVAKDASRPFIVEAGGVAVRAVGTAFNVRLDSSRVEVLVTEGKVQVDDAVRGGSLLGATVDGQPPVLGAGKSVSVALAPSATPQVVTVSEAELAQRLAWQPRLLDFTDAALEDIAAAFNRHNPVQLSFGDASLRAMRLSATFRSDNVEGFVRLMESDFGLHAERRDGQAIVLHRK